MFNLIKYEFRKSRTILLALLAVTAAVEIYFLGSIQAKSDDNIVIAMSLLMFAGFAVAIFAFVRGVTAYSGELSSKSSYLIFMTPNSTLKIVTSKMLYTMVNGLLFAAIYVCLMIVDVQLFGKYIGEWEAAVDMFKRTALEMGINVDQIAMTIVFGMVMMFVSIMATIAIAYDAITISRTLFRDKKWQWIPSLVLFFGLNWGFQKMGELLPRTYAVAYTVPEVMSNLAPYMIMSVAMIVLSIFACAEMLKRKISL